MVQTEMVHTSFQFLDHCELIQIHIQDNIPPLLKNFYIIILIGMDIVKGDYKELAAE